MPAGFFGLDPQCAVEDSIFAGNGARKGGGLCVQYGTAFSLSRVTVALNAAAAEGGGMGLTTMRERAEGIDGTLQIVSAPGEGATIRTVISSQEVRQ